MTSVRSLDSNHIIKQYSMLNILNILYILPRYTIQVKQIPKQWHIIKKYIKNLLKVISHDLQFMQQNNCVLTFNTKQVPGASKAVHSEHTEGHYFKSCNKFIFSFTTNKPSKL